MRKIEFERYLIDLESVINNGLTDMEYVDNILNESKEEYIKLTKELYEEKEKDNIIYLSSLISKYILINSFIDVKKDRIRNTEMANERNRGAK